jgi:HD superfamily phosphohydrolase YqeK
VALGVDQLNGVQELATAVALVATSVVETAVRAAAVHEAIRQKPEKKRKKRINLYFENA